MNKTRMFLVLLLLSVCFLSSCNTSKSIRFECPNIETNLSGLKSNGSLVLDGDGTHLMEMDSLGLTQINKPNEGLYYFAFSPEHNWIAYISTVSDDLVIAGMENKIIKAIPWEDDWAYVKWLNEEKLIIPLIQKSQVPGVSNFLVLNPFTNERNLLSADYPEMYYSEPGRIIEYNPRSDSVVYLQGGVSGSFYYTLWDIQSKTAIAQLEPVGDMHAFPHWSSDGSQFAMALSLFSNMGDFPSYEIFRVLRDGSVAQLTHLSDYYPWVYIADLSWSPDNRYIAFWYSSWSDDVEPYYDTVGDRYLGLLDVQTGSITSYCIGGELNAALGSGIYSAPLWSPDGRQIVFRSQIGDHYVLDSQMILLDIRENRAFLIAKASEPVGWFNPP